MPSTFRCASLQSGTRERALRIDARVPCASRRAHRGSRGFLLSFTLLAREPLGLTKHALGVRAAILVGL